VIPCDDFAEANSSQESNNAGSCGSIVVIRRDASSTFWAFVMTRMKLGLSRNLERWQKRPRPSHRRCEVMEEDGGYSLVRYSGQKRERTLFYLFNVFNGGEDVLEFLVIKLLISFFWKHIKKIFFY
jgi:hypothetical protein